MFDAKLPLQKILSEEQLDSVINVRLYHARLAIDNFPIPITDQTGVTAMQKKASNELALASTQTIALQLYTALLALVYRLAQQHRVVLNFTNVDELLQVLTQHDDVITAYGEIHQLITQGDLVLLMQVAQSFLQPQYSAQYTLASSSQLIGSSQQSLQPTAATCRYWYNCVKELAHRHQQIGEEW